jgi:hypothetical protein
MTTKGVAAPKTFERDFSAVVEIAVPASGLGAQLDAMHDFHAARGIKACIGRRKGTRDLLRWYFTRATTAETFVAEFGGTFREALRPPTRASKGTSA